ncbi:MAG: hypothetical protein JNM63_18325, partial [Spirochaetia bacterium]|nr:hypothetical protein [Spirochaetia bacterium]
GFRFGLTRTSKHKEAAMDFLYYLGSRKKNEKLNRIIGWIPAIKGAKMVDFLEGFSPHLTGVYGAFNFNMGGETGIKWTQVFSLFLTGRITEDEMIKDFEPFYLDRGLKDFKEAKRDWRRGILVNEQFLTGIRARAMNESGPEAESMWVKYRALTAVRQALAEVNYARQMNMVEKGPDLGLTGPYEYTPKVLSAIQAKLSSGR